MTLGASPSPADVVAELGASFPYTFPDARTRWLADVGASDPITFPTSFANKTACKVVDTEAASPSGTSHTFTGVSFGAAFTGRILIACVCLRAAATGQLDQTSVTIGGGAGAGSDNGQAVTSGPSIGAGVWATALNTGTSGDVVVNWSGISADSIALIMLSAAGISGTQHATTSISQGSTAGTSISGSLNIPSTGLLVLAHAHYNTNDSTLSGATERTEITVGSAARFAVGFNNRMSSQSGRSVSASWSGSTARALKGTSFS